MKIVAKNKNAKRNYEITETFEAGISLKGAEVKALRESKAQIAEAYARFENGELWLLGMNIASYSAVSTHNILDQARKRKLLMHRAELDRISSKVEQLGMTLVPISLYFKNGKAKIELGLGKGKKLYDKRQDIAKRDSDRQARRELAERNRR